MVDIVWRTHLYLCLQNINKAQFDIHLWINLFKGQQKVEERLREDLLANSKFFRPQFSNHIVRKGMMYSKFDQLHYPNNQENTYRHNFQ